MIVSSRRNPLLSKLSLIASLFRSISSHERLRQTLLLYSSEIGLVVLTFGTGIINSRFLGPSQYGLYTFVITIVGFVVLFVGFGYPQAGARVVAFAKCRREEQAIQGALVLVALIMGVCLSIALALASPMIDLVFRTQRRDCLRMAATLCAIAPLQLIVTQACRGANRIEVLAILNIFPKGSYLLAGFAVIAWGRLTANTALVLYFAGTLSACLIALFLLRIRFIKVRSRISELAEEVRRYGFKAYLGGIADNSTFQLNNLLIAGYVNTTWLGFYSIASTMVSPMARFSTSLSNSAYRSLALKDRLDLRLLFVNGAFLLVAGIFIAACARPIIATLLTKEFLPAVGLVYILLVTAFFQGMYQPINAFLAGHGKGSEMRSISFLVTAINLSVALALIPRFGAHGAALGSSIAKLAELLANIYYYRRVTKHNPATPNHAQVAPQRAY